MRGTSRTKICLFFLRIPSQSYKLRDEGEAEAQVVVAVVGRVVVAVRHAAVPRVVVPAAAAVHAVVTLRLSTY